MDWIRALAFGYMVALSVAAATNYIPGLTDANGKAFGIFELDIFDDLLHVASAAWAGVSAFLSRRASEIFFRTFGPLYLADGVMGLFTGVGYLDLGIIQYGVQPTSILQNIPPNVPHLVLGGVAAWAGYVLSRRAAA
ncbi:MAG: hypothetical protein IOC90_10030 [Methylocystis sp.]|jgi:hypothetical protein|nr:hypothetical protein [Methylocystis sp.]MCA3582940.1 hypothetical protein [Methylocystis sp.]MCA3588355.1 hypothetical protein [Methylocystis sp.]MCA3590345.1 hypothetical protein [Methylocystis sp.]